MPHPNLVPVSPSVFRIAQSKGISGSISSEWEFAKALEILEQDPEVYHAIDHWVEAADWIVWQLCGTYLRNACTAGYKGIHQDGAYPSPEFCAALNPAFARFVPDKLDPSQPVQVVVHFHGWGFRFDENAPGSLIPSCRIWPPLSSR